MLLFLYLNFWSKRVCFVLFLFLFFIWWSLIRWTFDLKVGVIFFIWLSFVVVGNNGIGSFDKREIAKTMEVKRERWGEEIRERTAEKAGNEREKRHCYMQSDARLVGPTMFNIFTIMPTTIVTQKLRVCLVCKLFSIFKYQKLWTLKRKLCLIGVFYHECLSYSFQFRVFKTCILKTQHASL